MCRSFWAWSSTILHLHVPVWKKSNHKQKFSAIKQPSSTLKSNLFKIQNFFFKITTAGEYSRGQIKISMGRNVTLQILNLFDSSWRGWFYLRGTILLGCIALPVQSPPLWSWKLARILVFHNLTATNKQSMVLYLIVWPNSSNISNLQFQKIWQPLSSSFQDESSKVHWWSSKALLSDVSNICS